MNRLSKEVHSFFQEVSKANELVYLVLFTAYIVVYLMLKMAWNPDVTKITDTVRYAILSIVMWGTAIYLFSIIATWKNLWKKNFPLVCCALLILALTFLFSRKMTTNSYGLIMDLLLCILVCGKSFKKVLRCTLGATVGMLFIAGIGVFVGFTLDLEKPMNVHPGHSLGIIYPNTWGYLVFLVLVIAWYLFLRQKPVITFGIFWVLGTFMFLYVYSRTAAILTFVFPVLATFIDVIERWQDIRAVKENDKGVLLDNKEEFNGSDEACAKIKRRWYSNPFAWVVILLPLLICIFMLIASLNVEWMHKTFYYTWFHNFAMRFVQSGLYFRTYGIPLIGNAYRGNEFNYVNVNGEFIYVGILDSSFAAYIIMRGILWLAYTLLWLCVANWKAIKKRDYAIPFIGTIFLFFAMMERPGLEMWYNFILLYPLAKVASKPGTERVLEFSEEGCSKTSETEARIETEESVVSEEKGS